MGSLVDPSYELVDPTPDVHALFCQFDARFFDGRLAACEVKWSPRMTTCAGLCCYEGRSGLCSIKLSTPLLKLRPRKDLVETLLHEMIHAFLFVTVRDRDRDGHGPQFQWHMHRINKEAGTHITIYHSFHAEVAVYKNHHWRCDGPCRERRPYFGWVKRASNRAPSKNDLWWADHERTCGGKYTKVSEPKEYTEKKEKAEKKRAEGGADKKVGGASKNEGGAKPAVADPKQPRIDSVFGGGGGGTRLGVSDGNATVTVAVAGGGGGGQTLGGGGGTGRSRLLDLFGSSAAKSTVSGKENRSIDDDDEITVVEVVEKKRERPRLRGGSRVSMEGQADADGSGEVGEGRRDRPVEMREDDIFEFKDDGDETEGDRLIEEKKPKETKEKTHNVTPQMMSALSPTDYLMQAEAANAERVAELERVNAELERLEVIANGYIKERRTNELGAVMKLYEKADGRQRELLREQAAWNLHLKEEMERRRERSEREARKRETGNERQPDMGDMFCEPMDGGETSNEVVDQVDERDQPSSVHDSELWLNQHPETRPDGDTSTRGRGDGRRERKKEKEEGEKDEAHNEDWDDECWDSSGDGMGMVVRKEEEEKEKEEQQQEEGEEEEVPMETVAIVRRVTQTMDLPIEQWVLMPSLPRAVPIYKVLTRMERRVPVVTKGWKNVGEEKRARERRPQEKKPLEKEEEAGVAVLPTVTRSDGRVKPKKTREIETQEEWEERMHALVEYLRDIPIGQHSESDLEDRDEAAGFEKMLKKRNNMKEEAEAAIAAAANKQQKMEDDTAGNEVMEEEEGEEGARDEREVEEEEAEEQSAGNEVMEEEEGEEVARDEREMEEEEEEEEEQSTQASEASMVEEEAMEEMVEEEDDAIVVVEEEDAGDYQRRFDRKRRVEGDEGEEEEELAAIADVAVLPTTPSSPPDDEVDQPPPAKQARIVADALQ